MTCSADCSQEVWKNFLLELSRHLTKKDYKDLLEVACIPDGEAEDIDSARDALKCLEKHGKISRTDKENTVKYLTYIKRLDLMDMVEDSFKNLSISEAQSCRQMPQRNPLARSPAGGKKRDAVNSTPKRLVGRSNVKLLTPESFAGKGKKSPEVHDEKRSGPTESTETNDVASEESIDERFKHSVKSGYCLILNVENFNNIEADEMVLPTRKGSSVDRDSLKKTFEWLKFTVEVIDDPTADEIRKALVAYAAKDYTKYDAFVCCILSHGFNGGIYGIDGEHVFCNELRHSFNADLTDNTLIDKPKIFIIQACRGDNYDCGKVAPDSAITKSTEETATVPEDTDFLFANATTPGRLSWRSESSGSWFVSTLCEVLQTLAMRVDLIGMLTVTNNKLAQRVGYPEGFLVKQAGEHNFSLRKIVYFSPDVTWSEYKACTEKDSISG